MTQLLSADPAQLESVLDGTYPIWGEGLSRSAYGAWNKAQMATEWGRKHLQRVVLINGETVLASAKRYDLHAVIDGRPVPVLGIGAVFTPETQRGRGYARTLVDLMIEDAAARQCAGALLFSEIGAEYYERAGFRSLSRQLVSIEVRPPVTRGAPATFVRSGEARDLPWIAEISARHREGAGFAVDRSSEFIAFMLARRRLQAGFGPDGMRHVEFFVSEEGHRPVAYVVISRGPRGAVLEDCGDNDPTGARIGSILQVMAARTPVEPGPRLSAWMPPSLRPPQLIVREGTPSPEIMMFRPLQPLASSMQGIEELSPIVYWQMDVF